MEGLHSADAAFVFAALFRHSPGPFLWMTLNNREAEKVADNLRFFLPPDDHDQILIIPGLEEDPYRGLSPHPEIATKRAVGLWKLQKGHRGFVITTGAGIFHRMPSPLDFLSNCIHMEVGGFIPLDHLLERLRENGYSREEPVVELGEYSSRGGIVDLFSPAHENPLRIELFGDQIESIREFDPSTQRSIELIPSCEIVPMRELIVNRRDIEHWHESAPQHWNEVRFAKALEEKLQFTENGELFNGFEYLFPLVCAKHHSLLDFFTDTKGLRVILHPADEFRTGFRQLSASREKNFRELSIQGELVLSPEELFLSEGWLGKILQEYKVFSLEQLSDETTQALRFDFRLERKYRSRIQSFLSDLGKWGKEREKVVLVMNSQGMAERMRDILSEYEVPVHFAQEGIDGALSQPLSVTQGKLSESFYSADLGLHVLTQENLFEERQHKPLIRQARRGDAISRFVSDFRDLKEGDYVVHVDHGIGVFRGLKQIGVGKELREFVVLTYREEAKLYVPVDRLDLIQKYSGARAGTPQVDRLGSTSWEKTKRRIRKSVRSLAQDLLKFYARREVAVGHPFSSDDTLSREFEEAFEFDETPDQLSAIRDVMHDMEKASPMDRLICGDVGYGKTEVAMRAAFKAVNDGKQVAVLAPTTVLVFQHYNTFRERFQGFPVRVGMISRFQNRQEQGEILERASNGLEDILIGTHRLLSKDVCFRDLGLIVVDEEQRFGVSQKEKLKGLKTEVDVISLSATPIPRTLNMSLIGLRDLSLIETPPKDRLAVQTVVVKFSRNIIHSAIDLELKRQGQVFFVHNSIETIHSIAKMIQEIVPEARLAVAHGQMREKQLEEVMLQFLDHRYDVLVSTTIIENGLDISRANTLIVNRAHRFGLAQLYQLRGRVGRSPRRAYAYFLIASEETLSHDARKRLATVKEFSELGSGFRIAAHDLETRGAGNLLGMEQHGHINAIGFELYMKLLEQTIRELKGEKVEDKVQVNIDLCIDIQIPEHYIDDSNQRLWLYKRISSVSDETVLKGLKGEIVDRFGNYPSSVSNLFEYGRLRLRAQQLKILSVERKGSKLFLKFREDTPISRQHIIELVGQSRHLSLSPEGILAAELSISSPNGIIEKVHTLLDQIAVLE